jgi:hypothetical protein
MADFRRRDGESASAWVSRLHYADGSALTGAQQDDLHAQRGLAADAAEGEERDRREQEQERAALGRAAAESAALRGLKAAARGLTPADRLALLRWLQDDMRD